MKHRVLVVEDDKFIQDLLAAVLENEGYGVERAGSGTRLFKELERRTPDLVLLDLGLPDEDGLVLLRQIRARSEMPVIVLTTRKDVDDRITALELGADDFITKPANPRELVLRIERSISRRASPPHNTSARTLRLGDWTLDLFARTLISTNSGEVALTRSEFDLLAAMFLSPGTVLSRTQLLDAVARSDSSPNDRTIDVLISRLRKKMEANPRRPQLILTVSGVGYKLSREG